MGERPTPLRSRFGEARWKRPRYDDEVTKRRLKRCFWVIAASLLLAATLLVAPKSSGQQVDGFPVVPLPEKTGPLRKALLLLREGKTDEARTELEIQRKLRPTDPEVVYQIARAYLMDFYSGQDPEKRRVSLGLAMESLSSVLKLNPDHIPALRAKALIHARAELLFYNPNLSYELAARVAKLEPHANSFLLSLSEWMSGRSALHSRRRPSRAAGPASSAWTVRLTWWNR